jgi:hypothetical protein
MMIRAGANRQPLATAPEPAPPGGVVSGQREKEMITRECTCGHYKVNHYETEQGRGACKFCNCRLFHLEPIDPEEIDYENMTQEEVDNLLHEHGYVIKLVEKYYALVAKNAITERELAIATKMFNIYYFALRLIEDMNLQDDPCFQIAQNALIIAHKVGKNEDI